MIKTTTKMWDANKQRLAGNLQHEMLASEERVEISDSWFHLKKVEKEKQSKKPKVRPPWGAGGSRPS